MMVKSILMALILLFQTIQIAATVVPTYQQFLNSSPKTFGVTCVTLSRSGSFQTFQSFFDSVSQMQCPLFTELLIMWNNKQSPESVLSLNQQKWRRKVKIHQTPYNSFLWRYQLPEEAEEAIYLSIDDQFIISCSQLMKQFEIVKTHSVGDLASVVGIQGRQTNFYHNIKGSLAFQQSNQSWAKYFGLQLSGASWIAKKQFQMMTIPNHKGLQKLRKIINDTINCDDVAFSYITSHFYPQLKPLNWGKKFYYRSFKSTLWGNPVIQNYRKQCFMQLINIFGYTPNFRVQRLFHKKINMKAIEMYIVYIKQLYYGQVIKAQKDNMREEIQRGDIIFGKGDSVVLPFSVKDFGRAQLKLSGQVLFENLQKTKQLKQTWGKRPFYIGLLIGAVVKIFACYRQISSDYCCD